ncbi:no significant blast hit [Histoplasma capsulatum G186AR]|nr:hypothetical protein I7I52_04047 [Histoplasma capsulatum]QSS76366.1 no significant blast hit [Histoplasma capsulatum G186AR]
MSSPTTSITMASRIAAAANYTAELRIPEHKTIISQQTHQSPSQGAEYKFIRRKLDQWFPKTQNYFHEYDVSCFVDGQPTGNPQRTIITRLNCSVVLRTECIKESENLEAAFENASNILLQRATGSGERQFLATVVGSWIKFFQDRNGNLTGLDGETEVESVPAIDFSTDTGAVEAQTAVTKIKENFMKRAG